MKHFGPPFSPWRRYGGEPSEWPKRRFLFRRFIRFVAGGLLLFVAGMAGLAFLFTRLFGGGGQTTVLVWVLGIGLALSFPLVVGLVAWRSFSRLVNPLARVMAAADAVAEGDFSVRVPEMGPGELGRLARSFNRMVAELERSDRLRRNLTADVAHELRTPLTILQGNLEGILDGVYQPDAEHLDLLMDETRRLNRLVEDLRTLSLAEAGQLPLKREPVDLAELLEDIATSFSGPAEADGVTLKAVLPSDSGPLIVTGDAGRLDQVLSNLVANALQHTPAGGMITLSLERKAGGAILKVVDNGRGISAEDLPNIFDRFWRGDERRLSGSGLGLAIARQLVQAHGGLIRAESQVNQGTTFTIELPETTPERAA